MSTSQNPPPNSKVKGGPNKKIAKVMVYTATYYAPPFRCRRVSISGIGQKTNTLQ